MDERWTVMITIVLLSIRLRCTKNLTRVKNKFTKIKTRKTCHFDPSDVFRVFFIYMYIESIYPNLNYQHIFCILKKAVIMIQIEEIAFVIYVTAQTLKMNSILFWNVLSIMILELIISKTIITEDLVCLNSFSY